MDRSISVPIDQFHLGAADGAGVRLRVEAPVQRVFVFLPAGRTHGEDTHGRLFSIIWYILHNGETRAAVGAVDEWIAETAIIGVEELAQAIIAGRGIRRDERIAFRTSMAVRYPEVRFISRRHLMRDKRIDAGQGWWFLAQRPLEGIKRFCWPLDLDGHTVAIVQDKAGQSAALGLSIHERSETHALHDAMNENTPALDCRSYCRCHR